MNEIEVISKIKREKLDERNYFNSLIESAYEEQMLSEDDIVNIQILRGLCVALPFLMW